jgi:enoyl-CoA hydratase
MTAGQVPIRTARIGAALVVILDRPERRNALTPELLRGLEDVLSSDHEDAAGIVVTGTDPAFSAGLDLGLLAADPTAFDGFDLVSWFQRPRIPVVAAVNGPAITGGMELALAADVRVASDRASFRDTHTRVGVVPGWGMTALLPQLVGPQAATELSLTARPVAADESARLGLVRRVVSHDRLIDEAVDLVEQMAAGDVATRRTVLELHRRQRLRAVESALVAEAEASAAWFAARRDAATS